MKEIDIVERPVEAIVWAVLLAFMTIGLISLIYIVVSILSFWLQILLFEIIKALSQAI